MNNDWHLIILSILMSLMTSTSASPAPKSNADFQAKFEDLAKIANQLIEVSAEPGDQISEGELNQSLLPDAVELLNHGANPRSILRDNEIKGVVLRNKPTIKYCFIQALKKNPQFNCKAVIGVQIKTSGMVSKVEISPDEVAESAFGRCLAPRVAKWTFPSFSGQKADGTKVSSIGYEFPLQLSAAK